MLLPVPNTCIGVCRTLVGPHTAPGARSGEIKMRRCPAADSRSSRRSRRDWRSQRCIFRVSLPLAAALLRVCRPAGPQLALQPAPWLRMLWQVGCEVRGRKRQASSLKTSQHDRSTRAQLISPDPWRIAAITATATTPTSPALSSTRPEVGGCRRVAHRHTRRA